MPKLLLTFIIIAFISAIIISLAFVIIRALTVEACDGCSRPLDKCSCREDTCAHLDTTPEYWTQIGWVVICRDCGSWTYLGDSL